MLGKLIKKCPRPGNIPNLKTPAINKELRKLNRAPKQRDFPIPKLQTLVGKSLTAFLSVTHVSKTAIKAKNELEPCTIFEMASNATKLLISVRNECSQVRREGLKGTSPFQYRELCDATLYKIDNNDFLVRDDMAKKANALGQARKFSQCVLQYSGRSSKYGPKGRFDRSQQYRKEQHVNPSTFKKKAFRDPVKSRKNDQ